MNWIGAISVGVFYAVILVVGIFAGWIQRRKLKSHAESQADIVLLAKRDLGLVVGILTMTATWVGGSYINGTVEAVFSQGIVWCLPPFGYSLSLIIGGILFAKPLREQGYVTMLDPLQQKYGRRMGGLLFLPALAGEICWTGAILNALGTTLAVILDINITVAVLVSSGVTVAYVLFGGLYSVAYTDVVQLMCILLGLVISVPFAWNHPAVGSLHPSDADWVGSVKPGDAGVYIESAFLLIFGGIPWQGYFQRVLATRSPNNARTLSLVAGFVCLFMATPCILLGIVAKGTDWEIAGYPGNFTTSNEIKSVLPIVLEYLTPEWVSIMGLGAVSAAIMSSADSGVLSASTLFTQNIYRNLLYPKASDRSVIIVTWIAIIFVTGISTAMALSVNTIVGMSYLCSDLVYVTLFPQLLLVVYCRDHCNTYGSLAAFILGTILRVCGGEPLIGLPALIHYPYFEDGVQKFPFRTLAVLLSVIVQILVSKITNWVFLSRKVTKRFDFLNEFERSEAQESLNK